MSVKLRYLLVLLSLLLILWVFNSVSRRRASIDEVDVPRKDTLVVQMGFQSGYKTGKGHPHGFHHHLFTECAGQIGKTFLIHFNRFPNQSLDALVQKRIDIVALDLRDSTYLRYKDDIHLTCSFYNYAWAVRKEDSELLMELNNYLQFKNSGNNLLRQYNRYFSSYSLKPFLATRTTRSTISPYDDMIKYYSREMGWDWRLLAAVIKKESRFCIGTYSSRGAMGLMQVLPSTAAIFGVTDCYSPSENVKAGTAFLSEIKANYESMGLDSANVVKFTLAAYNAGQSRIRDCILFAREQGTDSAVWDSVARVIPLMSLPEYYEQADYLRHGPFSGKETLTYVRDILDSYDEYRKVVR